MEKSDILEALNRAHEQTADNKERVVEAKLVTAKYCDINKLMQMGDMEEGAEAGEAEQDELDSDKSGNDDQEGDEDLKKKSAEQGKPDGEDAAEAVKDQPAPEAEGDAAVAGAE